MEGTTSYYHILADINIKKDVFAFQGRAGMAGRWEGGWEKVTWTETPKDSLGDLGIYRESELLM